MKVKNVLPEVMAVQYPLMEHSTTLTIRLTHLGSLVPPRKLEVRFLIIGLQLLIIQVAEKYCLNRVLQQMAMVALYILVVI